MGPLLGLWRSWGANRWHWFGSFFSEPLCQLMVSLVGLGRLAVWDSKSGIPISNNPGFIFGDPFGIQSTEPQTNHPNH